MVTTPPAGLILYGAPAAGKSAITTELTRLDARFQLFPVVKAGGGRTDGYAMVGAVEFIRREAAGEFVYSWDRYGARYAVAGESLQAALAGDRIPVVHLGSVEAVDAVTASGTGWAVVELRISRAESERRSHGRGTGDVAARLAAYDQTTPLGRGVADLVLDTEVVSAREAAVDICRLFSSRGAVPLASPSDGGR